MGIACVAEHFYDGILDAANILLRLTSFGLGNLESDEAVSEVALHPKKRFRSDALDKRRQIAFNHPMPTFPRCPKGQDSFRRNFSHPAATFANKKARPPKQTRSCSKIISRNPPRGFRE